jgi:hypothetical protein
MGDHIKQEGWDNWRDPANEQTARFGEYNSTGPGANADLRVKWSKQLTKEEADRITIETVLGGKDHWAPLRMSDNPAAHSYAAPALPVIPGKVLNVKDFGAVGDGTTLETRAIQAAIQATGAQGGGTVVVPAGVYLSGPLQLLNQINLRLERGATLRMLPLEKYPGGTAAPANFISGSNLHDVAVSGPGKIDGQGAAWWPLAKKEDAKRPRMLALSACERVLIEQVTLTNSPMFHITVGGKSSNVTVRRVTIRAPASTDPVSPSHNTDACDVSGRNILIEGCDVSVGDDNFACGGDTSDVLIENCTFGDGHGVSIGSYTRGGVSNVTVENCTFQNTQCGIRIKSDRDRGGLVRNVTYRNIQMTNVGLPILVYGEYLAKQREYRNLDDLTPVVAAGYPAKPAAAQTPVYRDLTFSNIAATVQTGHRAGLIWGLPEAPVENVLLENVNITADKPFGLYNAHGVRLVNCKITTPDGVNKLSVTNARVSITSH